MSEDLEIIKYPSDTGYSVYYDRDTHLFSDDYDELTPIEIIEQIEDNQEEQDSIFIDYENLEIALKDYYKNN